MRDRFAERDEAERDEDERDEDDFLDLAEDVEDFFVAEVFFFDLTTVFLLGVADVFF